ncbi:transmembrane protein 135-like [Hylaeus volcanicus]|uniref:transmembrane protein 135-like n=1 Tax=Hylaeus volcanicus TaxID=313075 RepID=UPI0023B7F8B6|nr:transmembrane protein 135-like [Hylaeus volcanicus]
MPSRLSKFIDSSCKDFTHPWTDSCTSAAAGLGLHTLQESLRLYTTVYLVTFLMKGKIPSKKDVGRTMAGILQSTAFLSWSSFSYPMFICNLRRLLGGFHLLTVSFLPSFLSSLTAILIERPSRRTLLCLYVSNIASETLFRMGQSRGYYTSIPKGETYIFAVSMALLLYFLRSKTDKQDAIYKILRVIGKHEEIEYFKENCFQPNTLPSSTNEHDNKGSKKKHATSTERCEDNILMKSLATYKRIIEAIKNQGKHVSCPHPYSCAHYILTGAMKLFSYGVGVQLVLNLVLRIKQLLRKPQLMKSIIFKKNTYNLAVFLGGFAGLYRLVSCSLRQFLQKDSSYYAIPAGFIAGLTFMSYSNNTVALYFMWKALQLLWNDLVEKEIVPEVKGFVIFLYCVSTALLFHVAIVEPQLLRPSYWKFLCNVSGDRIAAMSRIPIDKFGFETRKHLAEVLKKTNTTDKRIYSF